MDAALRALCIVFRTISRKVSSQKVDRSITVVGAQQLCGIFICYVAAIVYTHIAVCDGIKYQSMSLQCDST